MQCCIKSFKVLSCAARSNRQVTDIYSRLLFISLAVTTCSMFDAQIALSSWDQHELHLQCLALSVLFAVIHKRKSSLGCVRLQLARVQISFLVLLLFPLWQVRQRLSFSPTWYHCRSEKKVCDLCCSHWLHNCSSTGFCIRARQHSLHLIKRVARLFHRSKEKDSCGSHWPQIPVQSFSS